MYQKSYLSIVCLTTLVPVTKKKKNIAVNDKVKYRFQGPYPLSKWDCLFSENYKHSHHFQDWCCFKHSLNGR